MDAELLVKLVVIGAIVGPILAFLITSKKPKAKVTKFEGFDIRYEDDD